MALENYKFLQQLLILTNRVEVDVAVLLGEGHQLFQVHERGLFHRL